MLSTTSRVACSVSDALDGKNGLFQIVERGHGVVLPDELAAKRVEHRGDVAVRLDGDERSAAHLVGADHPAGELGGERGLAFAALAAHHGVALVPQQSLERQQLAAAPDEASLRLRRQLAEAGRERGLEVFHRLLGGRRREELRVVLFLEEHGHEPVLEPQLALAEDASAERVVLELALAGEHGVAHALARGERVVEGLDEAACGLDQHAVAHGDDGGDADLQQLGGDGLGRLLGLRGLAGFEEDERDAVIAQQWAEPVPCSGCPE